MTTLELACKWKTVGVELQRSICHGFLTWSAIMQLAMTRFCNGLADGSQQVFTNICSIRYIGCFLYLFHVGRPWVTSFTLVINFRASIKT